MSAISAGDSPDASSRRDRAAIAAQACQTCRSRKSKCDEQRPKCGLCTRLGVECVYREPQPTKKDKTLVRILSLLERVEYKVDRLGMPAQADTRQPRTTPADRAFDFSSAGTLAAWERAGAESQQHGRRASQTFPPADLIAASSHLTAAHRVLLWPSVYLMLTNARIPATADLHYIMHAGTPWFTHLELKKHSLPLPSHTTSLRPSNPSHPRNSLSLGFAGLTADSMQQLVEAYFRNFNIMHPILDRDTFHADFVAPIIRGGYEDRDGPTSLAMLVLALGSIACDGSSGPPAASASNARSGFRGGTESDPPGLHFLNEARRRLGFNLHDCSLENVQIYILQAAYYEACARHMDYWRCCASASMAFQVYIRCERVDWSSFKADLIKRVYWTCILHEDLYHLELDLPRTGIYTLEDKIPLPSFQQSQFAATSAGNAHFHYQFLAMIALRRLIARIHESLHTDAEATSENSEHYEGPPLHVVKELGRQLESWRTYLPQSLQWSDADAHSYPNINPLMRDPPGPLFTPESMSPGTDGATQRSPSDNSSGMPGLDIETGHLRTRFYYARYMIYRPFIFKALHFPEAMTPDDDAYAALALQSACMWPLAMAPCRDKKRLIPHLFTWTQNFLGILLLLRASDDSERLRRILDERVSSRDVALTVGLLLDWLRDMSAVDGMAEWAWGVVEPLYAGYARRW